MLARVALAAGLLAVTGPVCGRHDEPLLLKRAGRPLIFAHRGGAGLGPENTLPTLGTVWPGTIVELDVHATKDGELVVIHDDTVDRTTNGHGAVADLTLAEIRQLDAAYCFSPGAEHGTADEATCRSGPPDRFPKRGGSYQVPTLSEVLAVVPRRSFVGIELKARGIEQKVVDLVRLTHDLDTLVIGSEIEEVAIRVRALLPEATHYMPAGAAKCLALTSKLATPYAGCPYYEIFASPTSSAGLALDTKALVDRVHDQGVAIVYWTINDEAEIERLLRLGADGVFTDYPDRALRVVQNLRVQGVIK